ncbi:hypothetical protein C8J56DRAFT_889408 [Mycena floridula]|nr:hypothetical protein C8J56DRAFT_889408 [Mycena floridula]
MTLASLLGHSPFCTLSRCSFLWQKITRPRGTAHRPVDGFDGLEITIARQYLWHAMQGLLVDGNDEDDSETVMEATKECGATAFSIIFAQMAVTAVFRRVKTGAPVP